MRNHKDCEELQNDINKIYEWSKTRKMGFNVIQYHVLEIGKNAMRPSWTCKLRQSFILIEKQEKHLGAVKQDNLSP